ncbi:hypothetical protein FKM82_012053 [Ascaphus truei]
MGNFPLKTNDDSVSYWFAPVEITYPVPPYMSLREEVKRNQTSIVRLDMTKKYDSNDISSTFLDPTFMPSSSMKGSSMGGSSLGGSSMGGSSMKGSSMGGLSRGGSSRGFSSMGSSFLREPFMERFSRENSYRKSGTSLYSSIRDISNRWFKLGNNVNKTNILLAVALQGDNLNNKANFIISSYYSKMKERPVTLQIKDEDKGTALYLSCQSGTLQLQELGKEENLDKIDSDTERFIFLLNYTGKNSCSFESAISPTCFISTSTQSDQVVTLQPKSQDSYIMDFMLTSNSGSEESLQPGDEIIYLEHSEIEKLFSNSNRY